MIILRTTGQDANGVGIGGAFAMLVIGPGAYDDRELGTGDFVRSSRSTSIEALMAPLKTQRLPSHLRSKRELYNAV